MQFTNKTIREIALESPLTTRVFEEFKIDYCCGGRVDFAEACENAGVDPLVVEQKLEFALRSVQPANGSVEQSSPTELADFIIDTHHVFTKTELARLVPLMQKVSGKHGEVHPELFEIEKDLIELNDELLPHMMKEEMVLFPYIKELDRAAASGRTASVPHFGTVQNPVRMMIFEHEAAGELLRKMRALSSDYKIPEGACPSFGALYAGLEDLEKDLHRHIHLENNILFVRAIEMESTPGHATATGACCGVQRA
ncbi:MAG: iron-sulfur cluster repair di-iron protein [Acidobacteriota bacterium]